jgi:hypothetical protein
MLDSGSNSLYLAIKNLNLPKGSEVILPSFTWVSCAQSILLNNLIPVFCDVDLYTQNVTVDLIKQKITYNQPFTNFGGSIAVSSNGNLILVGASNSDSNFGAGIVYTRNNSSGPWLFNNKLTGDSANDFFGTSVATNSDGTVLIIGGPADDNLAGSNAGAALVYTGNSNVGWKLRQKLTGDNADDFFGQSVATTNNGNIIIRFDAFVLDINTIRQQLTAQHFTIHHVFTTSKGSNIDNILF